MTRRRAEPLVWLMFSSGGVLAAVVLPVLAVLFGLAVPLGWVSRPDRDHLVAVVGHPVTQVALLGCFVLMLVHSAHRFRYTLYDGLQVKMKRTTAVLCYGCAAVGSVVAVVVLWSVG
jgi:fumarate reductase subunit D